MTIFLPAEKFLLLIQFGDTLINYYCHSNAADFFTTYKEAAFMEFTLINLIALYPLNYPNQLI